MIKMLRLLLIISFIGIGFGQDEATTCGQEVCLSIGEVDSENYTIDVLYESTVPILGYQFDVTNVNIISGENGASTDYGLTISSGINSILAWGLSEGIPAGNGLLLTLNYQPGPGTEACIVPTGNNEQFLITTSFSGSTATSNSDVCTPISPPSLDCAGVWGGASVTDNCETCDDNPANDCVQDCLGAWGGDAELDPCGICNGDSSPNDFDNDGTPDDCDDTGFGDVELQLDTIDLVNKFIGLNFISNTPVYGIQFLIDNLGISIINASTDIPDGFTVGFSEDGQVLIYSSEGLTIPANTEINLTIGFNTIGGSQICIDDNNPVSFVTSNSGHLADVIITNDCLIVQQDCAGTWGGLSAEDPCGLCDGNGVAEACDCNDTSGLNTDGCCDDIEADCAGNCNGNSEIITYWYDADGDGLGAGESSEHCNATVDDGWVENYDDTDDSCQSNVHDCNSECDGNALELTYWYDSDGDGLGAGESSEFCNAIVEANWVENNDDDDDYCNSNVHDCAGICDGEEFIGSWYQDYDVDGLGNSESIWNGCSSELPIGFVVDNTDGDDNCQSNVHDCNGECDGNALELTYWYDTDGDGFGSGESSEFCNATVEANWVENNDDDDDDCYSNVHDCAGICDGDSLTDNCEICDDNPTNDCVQDCNEDWGGDAVLDNCNVCDNNSINDCTQDCNGDWGGLAYEDACGNCDSNSENDCDLLNAIAGPDRNLTVFHDGNPNTNTIEITLDGTLSTGDIESCSWSSGNRDNPEGCVVSIILTPGVYTYTLTVADLDGNIDSDEIIITINPEENLTPTAIISNIDLDFQAEHSGNPANDVANVILDGSNSSDSDTPPDAFTYFWEQISGNYMNIGENNNSTLSFDAPVGVYGIRLTVTDVYGATHSSDVSLTVTPASNESPVVNVGDDFPIPVQADCDSETISALVNLPGLNSEISDSDDDELTYLWTFGGEEICSTFECSVNLNASETPYSILLTVTDSYGGLSSDEILVTINSENEGDSPIATAPANQNIQVFHDGDINTHDVTIMLTGSGYDNDNEELTLFWLNSNGDTLGFGTTLETILVGPGFGEDDIVHVLTFGVSDCYNTDTQNVSVTLQSESNFSPVINLPASASYPLLYGESTTFVTIDGCSQVSDGDTTDILLFDWTLNNVNMPETTCEFSFTANNGDNVGLTVTDPYNASDSDLIIIELLSAINQSPVVNLPELIDNFTVSHDGDPTTGIDSVSFTPSSEMVSDPEQDDLSFVWSQISGNLVSFNPTNAELSFVANAGTYCFNLNVADPFDLGANDELCITINNEENVIPFAADMPDTVVTIAHDGILETHTETVTICANGTDTDGDNFSYLWNNGKTTECISETVTELTGTCFSFSVLDTYNEPEDGWNSDEICISLYEPNAIPNIVVQNSFEFPIPHDGIFGGTASLTIDASGSNDEEGDDLAYQWAIVNDLNTSIVELIVGENTNTLVINSLDVGDYTYRLFITDVYGNFFDESTYNVTDILISISPEENTLSVANAGEDLEFQPNHDGNPGEAITINLNGTSTSNDDADILNYTWDLISIQTGNNDAIEQRINVGSTEIVDYTYAYSGLETQILTFELNAQDNYMVNNDVNSVDQMIVTITPEENISPEAETISFIQDIIPHDGNANSGTVAIVIDGVNSNDLDVDDILSFSWADQDGNNFGTGSQMSAELLAGTYQFTLTVSDPYGANNTSQTTVIILPEPNNLPVVNAGEDNEIEIEHDGDPNTPNSFNINICGSALDNDAMDVHTYQWNDSGFSDNNCADVTIQNTDEATCHTFTVSDGYSEVSDEVCISLNEPNNAPVVNLGEGFEHTLPHDGIPGGLVNISVDIEDEDVDSHTCQWFEGELELTGSCSDIDLSIGTHDLRVVVTDLYGATGSDEITISVSEENTTPGANAGDDQVVTLDHDGIPNSGEIEITLNASGSSDLDTQDILSYSWYPGDLTLTDRSSRTGTGETYTTSLGEGVHYFSVIVADNYGADDTASVMITVNPEDNANPTVTAEVVGNPQAIHSGNPITDFGEFSISSVGVDLDDLDGEPTYFWELTSGEGITNIVGENTSEISGNALTGEYTFAITVTDVYGGSNTETISLTMTEAPNQTPLLVDISNISEPIAHDGDPETMSVNIPLSAEGSSDPDGDILSYYWLNSTDTIGTGINPIVEFEGALDLQCTEVFVYAHDGYTNNGIASKSFNVCIDPEPNTAPEITMDSNQLFQVDHDGNPNTTLIQVSLSSSVSDDPNDELVLSWNQSIDDNLQVELIGANTQTPQFELFLSETKELNFTFSAEDSYGLTTTQNVLVTLNPESNNPPVLLINHDAPSVIPHDGSGETNSEMVTLSVAIDDEIEDSHEIIWQNESGDLISQNSTEINLDLSAGSHSITAIVTDSYGVGVTHIEDILIAQEENNLPQISAGADILISLDNRCDGEDLGATDLQLTIDDLDEVDTHSCSWVDTDTNEELCDSCFDCNLDELEIGIYNLSVNVDDGYGTLQPDDLQIIVEETFLNNNPYANAGADEGYTLESDGVPGGCIDVLVDGCSSVDPDGCLLTYTWAYNGNELLITENCSDTVTLCNEVNEITEHNLSLIVSDPDGGVSDSDDLIITISPENNSEPVCSVSDNQLVTIDHDGSPDCNSTTVTFTGSCSDPEGNSLVISWTQSSGPALELNTTQGENFEIDLCPSELNQAQEYCFQINGTDEFGLIGSSESCVIVNPEPNNSPTVGFESDLIHYNIVHDGNPLTNSLEITLSANINDDDNNEDLNEIASISWEDENGISVCNTENCTQTVSIEGACFTVIATDNYGATGSDEICVTVAEPNEPPTAIIEELSQSDLEIVHNGIPNEGSTSITLDADSSTDVDGDEDHGLTYLWTTGETSPIITINGLTEGDYIYSVTVSDPYGASTTATINVAIVEPNEPPTADAGEDIVFTLPHNCTLDDDLQSIIFDAVNSLDSDGDFLTTYNWIDLSDGSSVCDDIDCAKTHSLGDFSYELTVADVYGATGKDTVNYRVVIPNNNPICILESETIVINESETYTINGCGSTDPEECSIEFSWTGEAISNACSNTFQAPELVTNEELLLNYILEVTDQYGATCETNQEVIIQNINIAPELEFSCYFGQELIVDGNSYYIPHDGNPNTSVYSIDCSSSNSSDFDNDNLTFNWNGDGEDKSGENVSFNLTEGLKTISVTVNDGAGGEVSQSITLDINEEPNEAPEIEFDAVLDVVEENGWHEFSDCDFATDPENDQLNWNWTIINDNCLGNQNIIGSTNCNNARINIPSLDLNSFCIINLDLSVEDSYDATDSEGKSIVVININEAPTEVANRNTDEYINLEAEYNCDSTIFEATTEICAVYDDADSDDLNFNWNCNNGISDSTYNEDLPYHESGVESCISVSFYGEGPHECTLEVTDIIPEGEYFDDPITVTKTYSVTLSNENDLYPIAYIESPNSVTEDFCFIISGMGSSHPEDCELDYNWKLDGEFINNEASFEWCSPELENNLSMNFDFELTVTDAYIHENSIIHSIQVNNINQPPIGSIQNIEDIILPHDCETENIIVELNALFSDEDNDELFYTWTIDGNLAGENFQLDYQLNVGTHIIEVEVFDGLASVTSYIEVEVFIDNNAPTIYIEQYGNFPIGATPGCEFESVNLIADCSDIDDDVIECNWYNSNNEIVGNGCNAETEISCSLDSEIYTLECIDCYGEVTIDSLEVHLFPLNVPPNCNQMPEYILTSIGDHFIFEGREYCSDPNENDIIEDRILGCNFTQNTTDDGCSDYELIFSEFIDECRIEIKLPRIRSNSILVEQFFDNDYNDNYQISELNKNICFNINLFDENNAVSSEIIKFKYNRKIEPFQLLEGNNLESLNLIPFDFNIKNLMQNNLESLNFIIGEGVGLFNTASGLQGNLRIIDPQEGYWYNTFKNCDDCTPYDYDIEIDGYEISPQIDYYLKDGNNLIGYFGDDIIPFFDVFGGFNFVTIHFEQIIGQGVGLFNSCREINPENWELFFPDTNEDDYPDCWSGNLNHLIPNKAYWVFNDSLRTLNMSFPENDESISREFVYQPEILTAFKPNQSMEQSFYLANEISVDGISAQYGDVLLSYNDNVLTGSAVIEDGPTTIAVMGRDMTDLTIGFHEVGQAPQFKIYLQNSGEIVELTSSNNAGWTSMSMHQMDRLIGEMPKVVVSEFSFNTPYPNPFNPVTTFSYGLPNEGKVTVTVYNLNGEKVTELLNENQTSGIYNMDWNAGSVSAGVYFINLEVNEINGTKYQQTQKVILLK